MLFNQVVKIDWFDNYYIDCYFYRRFERWWLVQPNVAVSGGDKH